MATAYGDVGDMIACHQIANGAKEKEVLDDEDMIPNWK